MGKAHIPHGKQQKYMQSKYKVRINMEDKFGMGPKSIAISRKERNPMEGIQKINTRRYNRIK